MNLSSRKVFVVMSSLACTAFVVVACGSDDGSQFKDGDGGIGAFEQDGAFGDGGPGSDADLYANDPPPKWCGPAGQPEPPQPTGTIECPSDKNKPGCACDNVGEQAPCWTGLRANRNLGVCKDGVTTCKQLSENNKGWGECEGQVLPDVNATKGAAACKCFSQGQWKIANLSPCFIVFDNDEVNKTYAVSTAVDGMGVSKCPDVPQGQPAGPVTNPNPVWSTDTLKVDCAGKFKLCYELKAGDFDNPKPTDCSLAKVCVEADYLKENVEQPFPDLGRWNSSDTACAYKWEQSGGYGEMTVIGESVRCDKVDDGNGQPYVFNRVRYCPKLCRDPANAGLPECANCQQSGSGTF